MIITSYLLDGILSNYLFHMIPLFTLSAFVIIINQYKRKTYLILITITGLLYDICYINSFLLIPTIFLIIGLINYKWFNIKPFNLINVIIINIMGISLFLTLHYAVLIMIGTIFFNVHFILLTLLKSIIINTIYIIITYFIYKYIIKKFIHHKVK